MSSSAPKSGYLFVGGRTVRERDLQKHPERVAFQQLRKSLVELEKIGHQCAARLKTSNVEAAGADGRPQSVRSVRARPASEQGQRPLRSTPVSSSGRVFRSEATAGAQRFSNPGFSRLGYVDGLYNDWDAYFRCLSQNMYGIQLLQDNRSDSTRHRNDRLSPSTRQSEFVFNPSLPGALSLSFVTTVLPAEHLRQLVMVLSRAVILQLLEVFAATAQHQGGAEHTKSKKSAAAGRLSHLWSELTDRLQRLQGVKAGDGAPDSMGRQGSSFRPDALFVDTWLDGAGAGSGSGVESPTRRALRRSSIISWRAVPVLEAVRSMERVHRQPRMCYSRSHTEKMMEAQQEMEVADRTIPLRNRSPKARSRRGRLQFDSPHASTRRTRSLTRPRSMTESSPSVTLNARAAVADSDDEQSDGQAVVRVDPSLSPRAASLDVRAAVVHTPTPLGISSRMQITSGTRQAQPSSGMRPRVRSRSQPRLLDSPLNGSPKAKSGGLTGVDSHRTLHRGESSPVPVRGRPRSSPSAAPLNFVVSDEVLAEPECRLVLLLHGLLNCVADARACDDRITSTAVCRTLAFATDIVSQVHDAGLLPQAEGGRRQRDSPLGAFGKASDIPRCGSGVSQSAIDELVDDEVESVQDEETEPGDYLSYRMRWLQRENAAMIQASGGGSGGLSRAARAYLYKCIKSAEVGRSQPRRRSPVSDQTDVTGTGDDGRTSPTRAGITPPAGHCNPFRLIRFREAGAAQIVSGYLVEVLVLLYSREQSHDRWFTTRIPLEDIQNRLDDTKATPSFDMRKIAESPTNYQQQRRSRPFDHTELSERAEDEFLDRGQGGARLWPTDDSHGLPLRARVGGGGDTGSQDAFDSEWADMWEHHTVGTFLHTLVTGILNPDPRALHYTPSLRLTGELNVNHSAWIVHEPSPTRDSPTGIEFSTFTSGPGEPTRPVYDGQDDASVTSGTRSSRHVDSTGETSGGLARGAQYDPMVRSLRDVLVARKQTAAAHAAEVRMKRDRRAFLRDVRRAKTQQQQQQREQQHQGQQPMSHRSTAAPQEITDDVLDIMMQVTSSSIDAVTSVHEATEQQAEAEGESDIGSYTPTDSSVASPLVEQRSNSVYQQGSAPLELCGGSSWGTAKHGSRRALSLPGPPGLHAAGANALPEEFRDEPSYRDHETPAPTDRTPWPLYAPAHGGTGQSTTRMWDPMHLNGLSYSLLGRKVLLQLLTCPWVNEIDHAFCWSLWVRTSHELVVDLQSIQADLSALTPFVDQVAAFSSEAWVQAASRTAGSEGSTGSVQREAILDAAWTATHSLLQKIGRLSMDDAAGIIAGVTALLYAYKLHNIMSAWGGCLPTWLMMPGAATGAINGHHRSPMGSAIHTETPLVLSAEALQEACDRLTRAGSGPESPTGGSPLSLDSIDAAGNEFAQFGLRNALDWVELIAKLHPIVLMRREIHGPALEVLDCMTAQVSAQLSGDVRTSHPSGLPPWLSDIMMQRQGSDPMQAQKPPSRAGRGGQLPFQLSYGLELSSDLESIPAQPLQWLMAAKKAAKLVVTMSTVAWDCRTPDKLRAYLQLPTADALHEQAKAAGRSQSGLPRPAAASGSGLDIPSEVDVAPSMGVHSTELGMFSSQHSAPMLDIEGNSMADVASSSPSCTPSLHPGIVWGGAQQVSRPVGMAANELLSAAAVSWRAGVVDSGQIMLETGAIWVDLAGQGHNDMFGYGHADGGNDNFMLLTAQHGSTNEMLRIMIQLLRAIQLDSKSLDAFRRTAMMGAVKDWSDEGNSQSLRTSHASTKSLGVQQRSMASVASQGTSSRHLVDVTRPDPKSLRPEARRRSLGGGFTTPMHKLNLNRTFTWMTELLVLRATAMAFVNDALRRYQPGWGVVHGLLVHSPSPATDTTPPSAEASSHLMPSELPSLAPTEMSDMTMDSESKSVNEPNESSDPDNNTVSETGIAGMSRLKLGPFSQLGPNDAAGKGAQGSNAVVQGPSVATVRRSQRRRIWDPYKPRSINWTLSAAQKRRAVVAPGSASASGVNKAGGATGEGGLLQGQHDGGIGSEAQKEVLEVYRDIHAVTAWSHDLMEHELRQARTFSAMLGMELVHRSVVNDTHVPTPAEVHNDFIPGGSAQVGAGLGPAETQSDPLWLERQRQERRRSSMGVTRASMPPPFPSEDEGRPFWDLVFRVELSSWCHRLAKMHDSSSAAAIVQLKKALARTRRVFSYPSPSAGGATPVQTLSQHLRNQRVLRVPVIQGELQEISNLLMRSTLRLQRVVTVDSEPVALCTMRSVALAISEHAFDVEHLMPVHSLQLPARPRMHHTVARTTFGHFGNISDTFEIDPKDARLIEEAKGNAIDDYMTQHEALRSIWARFGTARAGIAAHQLLPGPTDIEAAETHIRMLDSMITHHEVQVRAADRAPAAEPSSPQGSIPEPSASPAPPAIPLSRPPSLGARGSVPFMRNASSNQLMASSEAALGRYQQTAHEQSSRGPVGPALPAAMEDATSQAWLPPESQSRADRGVSDIPFHHVVHPSAQCTRAYAILARVAVILGRPEPIQHPLMAYAMAVRAHVSAWRPTGGRGDEGDQHDNVVVAEFDEKALATRFIVGNCLQRLILLHRHAHWLVVPAARPVIDLSKATSRYRTQHIAKSSPSAVDTRLWESWSLSAAVMPADDHKSLWIPSQLSPYGAPLYVVDWLTPSMQDGLVPYATKASGPSCPDNPLLQLHRLLYQTLCTSDDTRVAFTPQLTKKSDHSTHANSGPAAVVSQARRPRAASYGSEAAGAVANAAEASSVGGAAEPLVQVMMGVVGSLHSLRGSWLWLRQLQHLLWLDVDAANTALTGASEASPKPDASVEPEPTPFRLFPELFRGSLRSFVELGGLQQLCGRLVSSCMLRHRAARLSMLFDRLQAIFVTLSIARQKHAHLHREINELCSSFKPRHGSKAGSMGGHREPSVFLFPSADDGVESRTTALPAELKALKQRVTQLEALYTACLYRFEVAFETVVSVVRSEAWLSTHGEQWMHAQQLVHARHRQPFGEAVRRYVEAHADPKPAHSHNALNERLDEDGDEKSVYSRGSTGTEEEMSGLENVESQLCSVVFNLPGMFPDSIIDTQGPAARGGMPDPDHQPEDAEAEAAASAVPPESNNKPKAEATDAVMESDHVVESPWVRTMGVIRRQLEELSGQLDMFNHGVDHTVREGETVIATARASLPGGGVGKGLRGKRSPYGAPGGGLKAAHHQGEAGSGAHGAASDESNTVSVKDVVGMVTSMQTQLRTHWTDVLALQSELITCLAAILQDPVVAARLRAQGTTGEAPAPGRTDAGGAAPQAVQDSASDETDGGTHHPAALFVAIGGLRFIESLSGFFAAASAVETAVASPDPAWASDLHTKIRWAMLLLGLSTAPACVGQAWSTLTVSTVQPPRPLKHAQEHMQSQLSKSPAPITSGLRRLSTTGLHAAGPALHRVVVASVNANFDTEAQPQHSLVIQLAQPACGVLFGAQVLLQSSPQFWRHLELGSATDPVPDTLVHGHSGPLAALSKRVLTDGMRQVKDLLAAANREVGGPALRQALQRCVDLGRLPALSAFLPKHSRVATIDVYGPEGGLLSVLSPSFPKPSLPPASLADDRSACSATSRERQRDVDGATVASSVDTAGPGEGHSGNDPHDALVDLRPIDVSAPLLHLLPFAMRPHTIPEPEIPAVDAAARSEARKLVGTPGAGSYASPTHAYADADVELGTENEAGADAGAAEVESVGEPGDWLPAGQLSIPVLAQLQAAESVRVVCDVVDASFLPSQIAETVLQLRDQIMSRSVRHGVLAQLPLDAPRSTTDAVQNVLNKQRQSASAVPRMRGKASTNLNVSRRHGSAGGWGHLSGGDDAALVRGLLNLFQVREVWVCDSLALSCSRRVSQSLLWAGRDVNSGALQFARQGRRSDLERMIDNLSLEMLQRSNAKKVVDLCPVLMPDPPSGGGGSGEGIPDGLVEDSMITDERCVATLAHMLHRGLHETRREASSDVFKRGIWNAFWELTADQQTASLGRPATGLDAGPSHATATTVVATGQRVSLALQQLARQGLEADRLAAIASGNQAVAKANDLMLFACRVLLHQSVNRSMVTEAILMPAHEAHAIVGSLQQVLLYSVLPLHWAKTTEATSADRADYRGGGGSTFSVDSGTSSMGDFRFGGRTQSASRDYEPFSGGAGGGGVRAQPVPYSSRSPTHQSILTTSDAVLPLPRAKTVVALDTVRWDLLEPALLTLLHLARAATPASSPRSEFAAAEGGGLKAVKVKPTRLDLLDPREPWSTAEVARLGRRLLPDLLTILRLRCAVPPALYAEDAESATVLLDRWAGVRLLALRTVRALCERSPSNRRIFKDFARQHPDVKGIVLSGEVLVKDLDEGGQEEEPVLGASASAQTLQASRSAMLGGTTLSYAYGTGYATGQDGLWTADASSPAPRPARAPVVPVYDPDVNPIAYAHSTAARTGAENGASVPADPMDTVHDSESKQPGHAASELQDLRFDHDWLRTHADPGTTQGTLSAGGFERPEVRALQRISSAKTSARGEGGTFMHRSQSAQAHRLASQERLSRSVPTLPPARPALEALPPPSGPFVKYFTPQGYDPNEVDAPPLAGRAGTARSTGRRSGKAGKAAADFLAWADTIGASDATQTGVVEHAKKMRPYLRRTLPTAMFHRNHVGSQESGHPSQALGVSSVDHAAGLPPTRAGDLQAYMQGTNAPAVRAWEDTSDPVRRAPKVRAEVLAQRRLARTAKQLARFEKQLDDPLAAKPPLARPASSHGLSAATARRSHPGQHDTGLDPTQRTVSLSSAHQLAKRKLRQAAERLQELLTAIRPTVCPVKLHCSRRRSAASVNSLFSADSAESYDPADAPDPEQTVSPEAAGDNAEPSATGTQSVVDHVLLRSAANDVRDQVMSAVAEVAGAEALMTLDADSTTQAGGDGATDRPAEPEDESSVDAPVMVDIVRYLDALHATLEMKDCSIGSFASVLGRQTEITADYYQRHVEYARSMEAELGSSKAVPALQDGGVSSLFPAALPEQRKWPSDASRNQRAREWLRHRTAVSEFSKRVLGVRPDDQYKDMDVVAQHGSTASPDSGGYEPLGESDATGDTRPTSSKVRCKPGATLNAQYRPDVSQDPDVAAQLTRLFGEAAVEAELARSQQAALAKTHAINSHAVATFAAASAKHKSSRRTKIASGPLELPPLSVEMSLGATEAREAITQSVANLQASKFPNFTAETRRGASRARRTKPVLAIDSVDAFLRHQPAPRK